MKQLTDDERKQIEAITKDFASKLKTHRKGRHIFNAPKDSNFASFSSVNVGGGYTDGNPEFSFYNDEIDNFPPYDELMKIRRLVENERAKADAKEYAERRNRERKAKNSDK